MAKIEAGRHEIADGVIDLACVIDMVVRMSTPAAVGAELTLTVDVPRELPLVRGDERAIRQVILNLVSNAIKFTQAGGQIAQYARSESRGIEFGVPDSGVACRRRTPKSRSSGSARFRTI